MIEEFKGWHVGVAAEAIGAALFARSGLDVSVQYGANQPEYDLVVSQGENILKVPVKGSSDGGWGLTQSHIKKRITTERSISGLRGTGPRPSSAWFNLKI